MKAYVPKSVEEYMEGFPEKEQLILQKIRDIIFESAPGVLESISYGMPSYKIYGRQLVYFAGFKNHIGFYALPSGHALFSKELSGYKQGKGSVQFPLKKPIPYQLIAQIVTFRVLENMEKKQ